MKNIKTVKLEFLRSGPPHNQLLSPLTQYLATAGRHEAVTVQVPYEHQSFLSRLQYLSYRNQLDEHHRQTLREISKDISKILGAIPGLNGDLATDQSNHDTLVHLRLIFSASELALLPFEMGDAPKGFPGEGRPLSLQLTTPLVMTREVRNAQGFHANWTQKPKILFIAAAPPGVGTIPFKAHLLALRKAIDPWLKIKKEDQTDTKRLEKYLHVLPHANLQQIQALCAKESFTHIHILAHGIPVPFQKERFGLALHDVYNPKGMDVVDGERLAVALRCHQRNRQELSHPNVVTLASCDSGQQGTVMFPGGSLANALHNAGIPLVIGSQFPLTKRGSVSMVQDFYSRVLWGHDPRVVLHEIRLNLSKFNKKAHDWASLIAFVSLPDDFDRQLAEFRSQQADQAIQVALDWAHFFLENREQFNQEFGDDQGEELLEKLIGRLNEAIHLIGESDPESDVPLNKQIYNHHEVLARLGSAEKRAAQIFFERGAELASLKNRKTKQNAKVFFYKNKTDDSMRKAINYYQRAYKIRHSNHWGGLQYICLNMIYQLRQNGELIFPFEAWQQIREEALKQTQEGSKVDRAWAFMSLAELYLIGLAVDEKDRPEGLESYQAPIKSAIQLVGRRSYHCYTSMFQFRRYQKDNFLYINEPVAEAAEAAEKMVRLDKDFKPSYPQFPSS